MEWTVTAGTAAAGLLMAALSVVRQRRHARRPRPIGEVSFVPWNAILFLGLMAALFGSVHLLTLWGRG